MNSSTIQSRIESAFRKQAQQDKNVRNAYLLVHSGKLGIHLNTAEGKTGEVPASPAQPNHLASVGKLFTATLTGMLSEQGKLDFNDPIGRYLDPELMDRLHVYRGTDYSDRITIRHLLMQTSGLYDVFYPLWEKLTADPSFRTTPREAVLWGKRQLKPVAVPGRKHHYTDTNYYLLGMIIEAVTGKPFHEVMHERVFDPSGMEQAWMHGFSKPGKESGLPPAHLTIKGVNLLSVEGIHQIDYSGGSVVAPLEDFLRFSQALIAHRLVRKQTLDRMLDDSISMGFPAVGFRYGYATWQMKTIPLIMPAKFNSWGCTGVTGAFLFYHPTTESHIIGSFNDFSYRGKALQFMARKVIRELLRA